MSARAAIAVAYSERAERAWALAPHEEEPGAALAELDRALNGEPPIVGTSRRKDVADEVAGIQAMGGRVG